MASVNRIEIYPATLLTGNATSATKTLEALTTDFIGFLNVSTCHADTTVSVTLQHSPDVTNWFDVGTFTSIVGAAGIEDLQITTHLFPHVKAAITLSGTTKSATVAVSLNFDKKR